MRYKFIDKLKQLPFTEEIWLFGSRARGDHHGRSDIDLAIICPKATNADWVKVMDIVEEADTLLKIDYVRMDQDELSKNFYDNIVQEKQVLYAKNAN